MNVQSPNQEQRQEIIESVLQTFERRFYDPSLHGVDLRSVVSSRLEELLSTTDFAGAMSAVLAETRSHPTDFFHDTDRKSPLGKLIKATFHEINGNGCRWMFQDVLFDGPAHKAGVQPGAILMNVNGSNAHIHEPPIVLCTLNRHAFSFRIQALLQLPSRSNRPCQVRRRSATRLDI